MNLARPALRRWLLLALFALLALALSLRMLIDLAPRHLARVETLVSTAIGRPVHIGALQVVWHGWRPYLVLQQLRLRDEADATDLVRFEHARLEIDIPGSLLRGQFHAALLDLYATELHLLRDGQGQIALEGFDPSSNVVARWLLQQPRLRVQADRLLWRDLTLDGTTQTLGRLRLLGQADDSGHKLNVTLRELPFASGPVEFGLVFVGDVYADAWQGKSYLHAGDLARPWLQTLYPPLQNLPAEANRLSLEVWNDWQQGRPENATGEIAVSGEPLATQANVLRVPQRLAGTFYARATTPTQWRLSLPKLELVRPQGAVQLQNLAVTFDTPPAPLTISLAAEQIPLPSATSVLQFLLPDPARDGWLAQARPDGSLRLLRLSYQSDSVPNSRWEVEVDRLGFASAGNGPGISGVSGVFSGSGDSFKGHLDIDGGVLDVPKYMPRPIRLQHAAGEFSGAANALPWQLGISALRIETADFTGTCSGTLADTGNGVQADLQVALDRFELVQLANYMPLVVPARVREWIATAVKAGQASAVTAQLRGPLAAFPFDRGEGTASAAATLAGVDLAFLPRWPELKNLAGAFGYAGRTLHFGDVAGKTLLADLHDTNASIAGLGTTKAQLSLRGQAAADAPAALNYLAASPLQVIPAALTEKLRTSGAVGLDLRLELPFEPEPVAQISGALQLQNVALAVPGVASPLRQLAGRVDFDQRGLRRLGLLGQYQKTPVRFDLEPNSQRLRGRLPVAAEWLNRELSRRFGLLPKRADNVGDQKVFTGRTTLEVVADPGNKASAYPVVRLRSPLQGLGIRAPAPLGKSAAENVQLNAELAFLPQAPASLALSYGSRGQAAIRLGPRGRPEQLAITLGPGPNGFSGDANYRLKGSTAELSVTAWQAFLAALGQGASVENNGPAPRSAVDLQVENFEVGGFRLRNTLVRAHGDRSRRWRISLSGADASGTIRYFPAPNRLSGRFKQLRLQATTLAKVDTEIDPRRLPNIEFDCDDCYFDTLHLGKLEFSAQPEANGLHMPRFGFANDSLRVQGEGRWSVIGAEANSSFRLRAEAKELSRLLGQFGYNDSGFAEGKSTFTVSANWPGTPADFALANLAGRLTMKIENGRLLTVENRVGRIFGLLSIDTFWRRLSLDFRDIFGAGFAFDRIEGDFNIDDGTAVTDNMVIEGPAARVDVRGITGLVGQYVDQKATVSPAIAGTLPVASALFGPAGIGVGAALFLAEKVFPVLPRRLDSLMQSKYTIKGSWANPEVTKVSGF